MRVRALKNCIEDGGWFTKGKEYYVNLSTGFVFDNDGDKWRWSFISSMIDFEYLPEEVTAEDLIG